MSDNEIHSLIPFVGSSLATTTAGTDRVMSAMVEEMLAHGREALVTIDADALVREGKRLYRGEGMTEEDI